MGLWVRIAPASSADSSGTMRPSQHIFRQTLHDSLATHSEHGATLRETQALARIVVMPFTAVAMAAQIKVDLLPQEGSVFLHWHGGRQVLLNVRTMETCKLPPVTSCGAWWSMCPLRSARLRSVRWPFASSVGTEVAMGVACGGAPWMSTTSSASQRRRARPSTFASMGGAGGEPWRLGLGFLLSISYAGLTKRPMREVRLAMVAEQQTFAPSARMPSSRCSLGGLLGTGSGGVWRMRAIALQSAVRCAPLSAPRSRAVAPSSRSSRTSLRHGHRRNCQPASARWTSPSWMVASSCRCSAMPNVLAAGACPHCSLRCSALRRSLWSIALWRSWTIAARSGVRMRQNGLYVSWFVRWGPRR